MPYTEGIYMDMHAPSSSIRPGIRLQGLYRSINLQWSSLWRGPRFRAEGGGGERRNQVMRQQMYWSGVPADESLAAYIRFEFGAAVAVAPVMEAIAILETNYGSIPPK